LLGGGTGLGATCLKSCAREPVEQPAALAVSGGGDVYVGGDDGSLIELDRTE